MSVAVDALFVLTVLGLTILVAGRLPARPRAILIAWLLLTGVLAGAGAFLRAGRVPPYFAAVGLLSTAVALGFVCSRAGTTLLARTPPAWLVGVQSFRVVVEIVLWALAIQGRLSPADPRSAGHARLPRGGDVANDAGNRGPRAAAA